MMNKIDEQKDIVQEFLEDLTSPKFWALLFFCFNFWFIWYITTISTFPENIGKNILYINLMHLGVYNLFLTIAFIFFDKSVRVSFRIMRANLLFFFGFIFLITQRDFIFADMEHESRQEQKINNLKKQIDKLESIIANNLILK